MIAVKGHLQLCANWCVIRHVKDQSKLRLLFASHNYNEPYNYLACPITAMDAHTLHQLTWGEYSLLWFKLYYLSPRFCPLVCCSSIPHIFQILELEVFFRKSKVWWHSKKFKENRKKNHPLPHIFVKNQQTSAGICCDLS